jgi:hypothetical protein
MCIRGWVFLLFAQFFELFVAIDYKLPLIECRLLLNQAEPHIANPLSSVPPFDAFLWLSLAWEPGVFFIHCRLPIPSTDGARLLNPSLFSHSSLK